MTSDLAALMLAISASAGGLRRPEVFAALVERLRVQAEAGGPNPVNVIYLRDMLTTALQLAGIEGGQLQ